MRYLLHRLTCFCSKCNEFVTGLDNKARLFLFVAINATCSVKVTNSSHVWDDYNIRVIRWSRNGCRRYQWEGDKNLCERFTWKVKPIAISLHMLHSDVSDNTGLEQGTAVVAAKTSDSAVMLLNHDVER